MLEEKESTIDVIGMRERDHEYFPVELTLDNCIKCNICVTACPVAEVTDLFPGPKYEGPQAGRFRQSEQPSPDHSVDYCSGCRVCNEVCPTGVKIAEINARARGHIVEDRGLSLRNRLLGRNELMGKLGSNIPQLVNLGMHNPLSRLVAEKAFGIHRQAPLPHWSTDGSLGDWVRRTQAHRLKSDKKVVYFHGCATMYYEPFVGQATVAVLEHNGYEVIVPEQNCCGLPMLSNGEFDAGAGYYDNNVRKLVSYARQGLPIVGASPSCTLTLKEEGPELLDKHYEDAVTLKMATWDVFEWLRELHEQGQFRTDFRRVDMVLPYHAPCQYRAHRVGKPSLDILKLIPGLDIRESTARCCGIAGTYGYKVEKFKIAMDVGRDLFEFVAAQDAYMTACDTETCRWQIEMATKLPSRHPIEIVAAAYGLYDLETRQLLNE